MTISEERRYRYEELRAGDLLMTPYSHSGSGIEARLILRIDRDLAHPRCWVHYLHINVNQMKDFIVRADSRVSHLSYVLRSGARLH
jgi:hypothetical protein